MPWLYVDATFGLSGDMILASLVDLGVDLARISEPLSTLMPEHFTLTRQRIQQSGIQCTYLQVECDRSHHHRKASDLKAMVAQSDLAARVKERSAAIIDVLADAEARVHGIRPDEVQFHEVGAVDSIIDMIGAAIALEELQIDGLVFSPPALGHGTVDCQHGLYPIPAPATAYLLEKVPLSSFNAPGELTTPTGAAILRALADSVGLFSGEKMLAIGYGAGTRSYPDHPNVVRAILFEPKASVHPNHHQHEHTDQVSLLSANLDDLPAELMAHASQRLLDEGALDVWLDPVIMKKGRPGIVFNVLASPSQQDYLAHVMFEETSTLGIRIQGPFQRRSLARHRQSLDLGYGSVEVKFGWLDGQVIQAAPEYDTVNELSQASGKSAKLIYQDVAARLSSWRPA